MPALKINLDGSPHIHSWIRGYKTNGLKDRKKYICAHPDCVTWMSKYDLVGKRSLCPLCGKNNFILTKKDLTISQPVCLDCSPRPEAQEIRKKRDILEKLLAAAEEPAEPEVETTEVPQT